MRRIKTDLIKQNAVLDENIYASNGTLLIGKGTQVDRSDDQSIEADGVSKSRRRGRAL